MDVELRDLRLRGFGRISLDPGQTRVLRFEVSSAELRLLNRDMQWVVEPLA